MSEEIEVKESKAANGYVGRNLSAKEVKRMMARAKTPEERAVLASLMPKPQKRH